MPQRLIRDIIPGIIFKNPEITELKNEFYEKNNVRIYLLRLDEIHPVISGNKLFKLYYFLEEAKNNPGKKIITFGRLFQSPCYYCVCMQGNEYFMYRNCARRKARNAFTNFIALPSEGNAT